MNDYTSFLAIFRADTVELYRNGIPIGRISADDKTTLAAFKDAQGNELVHTLDHLNGLLKLSALVQNAVEGLEKACILSPLSPLPQPK